MKIELDVDLESYYTMVVTDSDNNLYCVSGDNISLVELRMELLLLELGINLDADSLDLN